jgi:hypothetical protein
MAKNYQTTRKVELNVDMFWGIAPCDPYVRRRFGRMSHLHLLGWKSDKKETTMQQVADMFLLNVG